MAPNFLPVALLFFQYVNAYALSFWECEYIKEIQLIKMKTNIFWSKSSKQVEI